MVELGVNVKPDNARKVLSFNGEELLAQLSIPIPDDPDLSGFALASDLLAEVAAREAADTALAAADVTLQTNITAEETARIAADAALQSQLNAIPAGSTTQVQYNASGVLTGSTNLTIVGTGSSEVATLLKNFVTTNQKTAGLTGENPSKIITGGPNTKGFRVEGQSFTGTATEQTGLVEYWILDEASGDRIGELAGLHLAPTGAPGNTTGIITSAVDLNGSSQYLGITNNATIKWQGGNFTVQAWIYLDTQGSWPPDITVLWTQETGTSFVFWELGVRQGNDFVFKVGNAASTEVSTAIKGPSPSNGVWYHVIGEYDSATKKAKIWVNGVAGSDGGALTSNPTSANIDFFVGKNIGYYTDGRVCEIGLWNRALNTTEIAEMYNSGAGNPYAFALTTTQTVALAEFGPSSAITGLTILADGSTQYNEGINIVVGTSTGTKIGTSSSQKLGFWGKTPVVRGSAWSITNVTTDRSYDANATTLDEVADALGTLIQELQNMGILT